MCYLKLQYCYFCVHVLLENSAVTANISMPYIRLGRKLFSDFLWFVFLLFQWLKAPDPHFQNDFCSSVVSLHVRAIVTFYFAGTPKAHLVLHPGTENEGCLGKGMRNRSCIDPSPLPSQLSVYVLNRELKQWLEGEFITFRFLQAMTKWRISKQAASPRHPNQ